MNSFTQTLSVGERKAVDAFIEAVQKDVNLTFDDISLVPQYSDIASRHDVDLSCGEHFGVKMTTPILSANMATVTGEKMCKAMRDAGGIGVLHRFQDHEDIKASHHTKIVSVGVDNYKERLISYEKQGLDLLCVDVAHGHHKKVGDLLDYIKETYGDFFTIIAGNVCTASGARFLVDHGADIIKVGVGPGSHCTTRVVTGHGVPQLSALIQCRIAVGPDVGIIADGGIRNSGDIAKALCSGADYVMIGRLLAGCSEAPSEVVQTPQGLKKVYRGSASYEAQVKRRDKRTIIAEGVQSYIPYTGPVSDVIAKLTNGIKSACSYTGARTLDEFKEKATLVRVSGASYVEGTPHGA